MALKGFVEVTDLPKAVVVVGSLDSPDQLILIRRGQMPAGAVLFGNRFLAAAGKLVDQGAAA
jgi:hypothetical protein